MEKKFESTRKITIKGKISIILTKKETAETWTAVSLESDGFEIQDTLEEKETAETRL